MTHAIGPSQKVLKELAALIAGSDNGAATVEWGTTHGRRVVEMDASTSPSGEAVATGDEPVDYVQVGGILPAQEKVDKATATQAEHPVARSVAKSFADAWRSVFPPKESR